jgi:hypothetical protein
MLALWIILSALGYVFMGGLVAGRYEAIERSKCGAAEHFDTYTWCGHSCITLWCAGPLWPLFLPAVFGVKAGFSTKDERLDRKHQREIKEAKHKAELAKFERMETEELNRQLEAAKR